MNIRHDHDANPVGVDSVRSEVTCKSLTTAVDRANVVVFRYPKGAFGLHHERAAVLYLVSGWPPSAGLTHVRQDVHGRDIFLPLLNAQKSSDIRDFNQRAPANIRGLEPEVVRRNEVFDGKSLLLSTSEFYELVRRWEARYHNAFSNPHLLCTYRGDLPNEVKRVVGREEAVQLQWKRCVNAAPRWKSDSDAERALYDFIFQKHHDVIVAEYCGCLRMVSDLFKREKATQQALRATLKAARAVAKPRQEETNDGPGGGARRNAELIGRAKTDLLALGLRRCRSPSSRWRS